MAARLPMSTTSGPREKGVMLPVAAPFQTKEGFDSRTRHLERKAFYLFFVLLTLIPFGVYYNRANSSFNRQYFCQHPRPQSAFQSPSFDLTSACPQVAPLTPTTTTPELEHVRKYLQSA